MNAHAAAQNLADPIQTLGMKFYFDDLTRRSAHENHVNVVEFYGLGRAGVMGDVDTQTVIDAFTFFDPSLIDYFWTQAKEKADPVAMASAHVQAAYAFADATFGALDVALLAAFSAAARAVADAQPRGVCALVDGYRQYPWPSDPVHGAYLGAIVLRELRGGLHILAVNEVGLDVVAACYLQGPEVFALHGYQPDAPPEVSDEQRALKTRAEESTDQLVADALRALSDEQRTALVEGARAMFAALDDPVPVAR
ncbi:MAG TPA: hypothetical protein VGG21_02750 [Acidimicrobiales bacterium]